MHPSVSNVRSSRKPSFRPLTSGSFLSAAVLCAATNHVKLSQTTESKSLAGGKNRHVHDRRFCARRRR